MNTGLEGCRDNLEAFIADGGNAAFFSGNSVCWQVRNEDEGRALTCWKQWYNTDPIYKTGDYRTLSTLWSHYLVGRPENELTRRRFSPRRLPPQPRSVHGWFRRIHSASPGSLDF